MNQAALPPGLGRVLRDAFHQTAARPRRARTSGGSWRSSLHNRIYEKSGVRELNTAPEPKRRQTRQRCRCSLNQALSLLSPVWASSGRTEVRRDSSSGRFLAHAIRLFIACRRIPDPRPAVCTAGPRQLPLARCSAPKVTNTEPQRYWADRLRRPTRISSAWLLVPVLAKIARS
jgi:hypothetical protein